MTITRGFASDPGTSAAIAQPKGSLGVISRAHGCMRSDARR